MVNIINKFGVNWKINTAKTNELYIIENESFYNTCKKWFMLVQDKNNITQYLAYHNTTTEKNIITTHIKTSTYSSKQKLYEIDNIELNKDDNLRTDYDTIFTNKNLYAIPDTHIDIIEKIDPSLGKYIDRFKNDNITNCTVNNDLLRKIIIQYNHYRKSQFWTEQYKYDYFEQHNHIFDNLDNLEEKIKNLGSPNFVPFMWKTSVFRYLCEFHLSEFKNILVELFNENEDLISRINLFLKTIKEILIHSPNWKSKDRINVGVESASFFLALKDPTKYLLYTRINPYNTFSKNLNINITTKNEDKYVQWIKYCNDILRPEMNNFLGFENNLLDCQDLIWWYHSVAQKNNSEDIAMDNNLKEQSLNQILYGPPGTGKTYSIQEYIQNLLRENPGLNTNSEEQKLNDIVKDLSWYTTIAISMYLNGKQNKYKVSDLMNQKIIKAFALTRENKNLRAALWAQMQIHTSENCKTVNYTNRQAPFIFEKNENSEWYLTEDGIKYVEENLTDQITQYKAPSNTRKIEDFYKFITFHQSYSYEEFVEGIKPKIDVNDDSSTISYEYNRGIFKEICQQANSDPDNKYLLIIDEINRGNISKIFGELITLIETNKRVCPNKERNFENTKVDKEQLLVTLPYTKSKFGVPSNLYILGTMNTSDRSIASIDIALRRRFKFVEMMPRPEKLVDKNNQPLMVEDINLQNLLKTINERISYILDRDHQIGHSYFMNWKNYDMTTLKNVWFDEIMPLLNEYFYSDWDKLQAILGQANEIGAEKSFIVKIKKPNLPYETDCSDEEAYYNFSKKEETSDEDFKMMLENAKLV